jgi:hypothetical protein
LDNYTPDYFDVIMAQYREIDIASLITSASMRLRVSSIKKHLISLKPKPRGKKIIKILHSFVKKIINI